MARPLIMPFQEKTSLLRILTKTTNKLAMAPHMAYIYISTSANRSVHLDYRCHQVGVPILSLTRCSQAERTAATVKLTGTRPSRSEERPWEEAENLPCRV
jgi:hypothetical protein